MRNMRWIDRVGRRIFHNGTASTLLILFVCICVVSQMLGAPVTLLGLLTSDTPVESLSEDFSILPIMPELGKSSRSSLSVDIQPLPHLPIFSTTVFHPPQV
jgi:hypothetical protein